MDGETETRAKVFKALSDPKRLAILDLLREGELCACVIMERMGMGQSAVSYHMKSLCDAGLVTPRQAGKWTHYCICPAGMERAAGWLQDLTQEGEGHVGCCAE